MPQPKIIFVNRVYWPNESATAQLLCDLAEGLAARGHAVHVITSGEGAPDRAGVTVHRTGGTDRHTGLGSRTWNYVRFLLHARELLGKLVQPGDVVVLKTDPPLLAAWGTDIACIRGARVVQWVQDIYPEIVPLHSGKWLNPLLAPLRLWRNRAWRRSAACVVVGADMQPAVESAGTPAERIRVLPNWAPRELDAPIAPENIAAVRSEWGLADKFILTYSGNLGRVHEFSTILEAAARLRGNEHVAFAFVGSGARFEQVREAAATLGNVHFFPPVCRPELAASLAAADAHLVTLRPGFERLVNPSKLAGVLAVARPAIFVGSTGGSIAALLREERCGVALEPGDAAGLAKQIVEWAASAPSEAVLRRDRARAAFRKHFRFEDLLDAWERLLVPAPDTR